MKFINLTENGKTIFVNPALIMAYGDKGEGGYVDLLNMDTLEVEEDAAQIGRELEAVTDLRQILKDASIYDIQHRR